MSQVINTNVLSLNAQRNLSQSQGALAQSLERLSSGLRINSAKDDAAGLAITERFTTQIRGLNQAVRNANDGISLAQTGEGALQEVQSNLQRIRELAVQSANATNSASDREAINREVQQRLQEIDRVAAETSFNGQKILDGTFGDAKFQVGANVGETIDLNLDSSTRLEAMGALATAQVDLSGIINEGTEDTPATYTTGDVTALLGEDLSGTEVAGSYDTNAISETNYGAGAEVSFEVDGFTVTLDTDYTDLDGVANAIATQVNDQADDTYTVDVDAVSNVLTITNTESPDAPVVNNGTGTTEDEFTNGTGTEGSFGEVSFAVDTNAVSLNSADGYATLADMATEIQAQLGADYVVSATNDGIEIATAAAGAGETAPNITDANSFSSGLFAGGATAPGADGDQAAALTVDGDFNVTIGDGDEIAVADGTYETQQAFADAIATAVGNDAYVALADDGTLSITSSATLAFEGNAATVEAGFAAEYEADGDLTEANVLTVEAANDVIQRVDSALTSVSDIRSDFGAIQNRFESTINNLTQTVENLSASRSRIQDADFAAETAELTRAQILQQAGTSVLAQANAVPQNALALLQ